MADNKHPSERVYAVLIRFIIAGMFIGIFGMIQPWSLALFKPGFLLLLYSTLAYTVLSHVTPRGERRDRRDREERVEIGDGIVEPGSLPWLILPGQCPF